MRKIGRWWQVVAAVAASVWIGGCGGGDGEYWDEFRPRAATVNDLAQQTFEFRDFRYGAVFDQTLVSTTTELAFLNATPAGAAWNLPYAISARSATSSGLATFQGDQLLLEFQVVDSALPFHRGDVLRFRVTADVDDGRIHLHNLATGESQTSAPR